MRPKKTYHLISKYIAAKESKSERKELYRWLDQCEPRSGERKTVDPIAVKEVKHGIMQAISNSNRTKRRFLLKSLLAATIAAAIICVFVYKTAYQKADPDQATTLASQRLSNIYPKQESATLLSSTGHTLLLDSISVGKSVTLDGLEIKRISKNVLQCISASLNSLSHNLHYTIATSGSKICTLHLPDGTHVSLQAASSLIYPVVFNKKNRAIKLRGEAYFEVVKQAGGHPFTVETANQRIEVLGTKFNIKTDTKTGFTKTALAEGLLQVVPLSGQTKPTTLHPGQESTLTKSGIDLKEADPTAIAAWTKGFFVFDGDNASETFTQIGRWYGINIEIKDKRCFTFKGKIPNTVSLDKLIEMLHYAEIPTTTLFGVDGKVILRIG